MKKIDLYSAPIYSELEKKQIANYSKLFDFAIETENQLKLDGVEISKQSIQKEIKQNCNVDFETLDGFEFGLYTKDKASNRLTNLIASGSIRKDFFSKDCRTALSIEYIKEMQGISDDIASTFNPTLDNVNSKIVLQDKTFNDIITKAKALNEKIKYNATDARNRKRLQELKKQAVEFIA